MEYIINRFFSTEKLNSQVNKHSHISFMPSCLYGMMVLTYEYFLKQRTFVQTTLHEKMVTILRWIDKSIFHFMLLILFECFWLQLIHFRLAVSGTCALATTTVSLMTSTHLRLWLNKWIGNTCLVQGLRW